MITVSYKCISKITGAEALLEKDVEKRRHVLTEEKLEERGARF
jgi:hypothetical protein